MSSTSRRYWRYIVLIVLMFVAATLLLVWLAGDSQEAPFNYIVH